MRDPTPDPDRKTLVMQQAIEFIARELERRRLASERADAMSRRRIRDRRRTTDRRLDSPSGFMLRSRSGRRTHLALKASEALSARRARRLKEEIALNLKMVRGRRALRDQAASDEVTAPPLIEMHGVKMSSPSSFPLKD